MKISRKCAPSLDTLVTKGKNLVADATVLVAIRALILYGIAFKRRGIDNIE